MLDSYQPCLTLLNERIIIYIIEWATSAKDSEIVDTDTADNTIGTIGTIKEDQTQ